MVLSELFRILKPGGSGILMVLINLKIDKIKEDSTINDIGKRWRDLVRMIIFDNIQKQVLL
jgi:ubiquinone/menaquinone biosynthesis C-methylase UbiE